MDKPLVSVIIPTYSRPEYIVRAIDSVLGQTYKNIEIIVVDDNGIGSCHQIETENVLKDYITQGKITYIRHKTNKNGSAARNTGFRASYGEYINFLDDDDYFLPTKIEKQIEILNSKNAEYGAVCCNMRIIKRASSRHEIHHFDTSLTSVSVLSSSITILLVLDL